MIVLKGALERISFSLRFGVLGRLLKADCRSQASLVVAKNTAAGEKSRPNSSTES